MISRLLFLFSLVLLLASVSEAASRKIFIPEFKVVGESKKDDLKAGLQAMLASRLGSEGFVVTETAAAADSTVTGTYVAFGKVFSIDIAVKDRSGAMLSHHFEQGESQDELIPAVTRVAAKVSKALAEAPLQQPVQQPAPTRSDVVILAPKQAPTSAPVSAPASADESPIIKAEDEIRKGKLTRQLKFEAVAIAAGASVGSGREIYVTDGKKLTLYLQGESLEKVAETEFARGLSLVSIDTADIDGNGTPEVYVTLVHGELLASQVWAREGNKLVKKAEGLPFFFRAVSTAGGNVKLYGQKMGLSEDFEGEVSEVVFAGGKYSLGKGLKLPRGAFLYNFNFLKDKNGETLYLLLRADGYLTVHKAGEEIWRSVDKFGGSTRFFEREDLQNVRTTGAKTRMVYIEQRITVTPNGEIIVPKNSGRFGVGNFRAYESNDVHSLVWSGESLDEKWRTKASRRYLADYFFDQAKGDLVLLEVVKTSGVLSSGLSEISTIKVD